MRRLTPRASQSLSKMQISEVGRLDRFRFCFDLKLLCSTWHPDRCCSCQHDRYLPRCSGRHVTNVHRPSQNEQRPRPLFVDGCLGFYHAPCAFLETWSWLWRSRVGLSEMTWCMKSRPFQAWEVAKGPSHRACHSCAWIWSRALGACSRA